MNAAGSTPSGSDHDEPSTGVGTSSEHSRKPTDRAQWGDPFEEKDTSTDPKDDHIPAGSGGDATHGSTQLQPVLPSKEFPPLSLRPIPKGLNIESISSADRYTLEKQTPVPPGQEVTKVEKDFGTLVPESEKMISSGLQRSRHSRAMTAELKLLLENEKKILNQITRRCNAFTQLKEENKQKTEEWYNENEKRLRKCDRNIVKLSNCSDDSTETLKVEEFKSQVQQKVVLELVNKTAEVASDISVQLSIENTIVNDVDANLTGLKKHSAVMMRLVDHWLKMLNCQDQHEVEIMERWGRIKQSLKEVKEKPKSLGVEGGETSEKNIISLVNDYNDRIKRLEKVFCAMSSAPSKADLRC